MVSRMAERKKMEVKEVHGRRVRTKRKKRRMNKNTKGLAPYASLKASASNPEVTYAA